MVTIIVIQASDLVVNSRADINANFAALKSAVEALQVNGVDTPTVTGNPLVYDVAHQPKYIVVDGSSYFETVHYTYAAGQITLNPLISVTQYIRSIY